MKAHFIHLTLIAGMVLLPACKRTNYRLQDPFPKEYISGYEEIYGHCYDSVPYGVVALDLYSEGLELDKDHRMQGTGYNLYLSDIFVPDSLLTEGEYKSIMANDSSPIVPYTFLSGRDFDGTPTGMYLLRIEEGKLMSIQLLDSGRFVMSSTTDDLTDIQFTLYYSNSYGSTVTYTTHFQGPLTPWLKK